MKRSICIFAAQYLPHLGGVERYTYNLARKLVGMGDEVTIVTSNVQGLKSLEKIEGVKVYRLPCINLLEGRYPVIKPGRLFHKLHKKLRKNSYDLVIVNTRFYIHSLYGTIFAKMQRAKCIVIDHGTDHLRIHNKFWDNVGHAYEHILTKCVQIFCKDFYGVSQACTEWLKHFHIKPKGVIYNAIDLSKINNTLNGKLRDFRSELAIGKEGIIISFTGRLLKEKGILNLIKAVNELEKIHSNVYLLIAGDGDLEDVIHQKANSHIIPLGRLEFDNIIGLLKQTDIFCLPSDSEGFSTSILEAAACGCFIVTTERGGAKELVLDKSYGMVIKNNKAQDIKAALQECIEDKEYRLKAIEKTYEWLNDNFTWDIVSEQVHNIK